MSYLKKKRVGEYTYYQLTEAFREGGVKKERVLLHLGRDLESPEALKKWWNFLGKVMIPYKKADDTSHWSHVIINLDVFLRSPDLKPTTDLVIRGLTLLTQGWTWDLTEEYESGKHKLLPPGEAKQEAGQG